ncbi:hypothetical protein SCHPADRAFT_998298 [Schizopora paradoxa]|uniref:DUF6534 domain-containing protein n=1 Tax=Schizopora paradoxa TaxID=27342 RepID=A0A0H2RK00_9AGAM|nr:hypothetical protein SCHPADRAFT_998298 [Schizopora paradoxa]
MSSADPDLASMSVFFLTSSLLLLKVTNSPHRSSGPLLLGYLFNWGLFGVLSVQVYFYYLAFPRDRRITRLLVAGIYTLELTQTILLTHDAFDTYARHFGDVAFLNNLQLLPLSTPIFSGLVSCAVQIHYGYVLRMLSGSRLLGFTVAFFSVVQCSAAFIQGVQAFIIKDITALATRSFASETVWLAGSAICDVIIAIGMTFILCRKDTRLPATHALITKLVRLTVETGCLTAVSAIIQMALFMAFRDKTYFACLALALAKLYSNSLLAILNSRIRIEDAHATSGVHRAMGSSLAFYGRNSLSHRVEIPRPSLSLARRNADNPVIDVHVQRHTETWTAEDDSMVPMDCTKSNPESTMKSYDLDYIFSEA